ncbi:Protein white [Folsomia candida]|uniref:Protein white n=1 Tax=Folsomia candida TaxID=158441 RepID=A0A226F3D6_FOLCA|nr:Protein white [Folsomia candida]
MSQVIPVEGDKQGYENSAYELSEVNGQEAGVRHSGGMTYTWSDINVYANKKSDSKLPNCFNKKGNVEQKHILKNVTGIARPGELLAIMGASGAGKTTLLNVLTCRNTGKLNLSGERLINGTPVDRTMLASISAYIQQSDIFIGTLTPREHLQFQATLRMDQAIPYKKRMERVEEVIRQMGLTGCADTIIGIPGRVKGLSGGQQKRLSIATEVSFISEPTTGLDSFMAQSIVKSLKTLAAQGKTIICTIHQPASEVFALFDRLLLMSEGRTAFIGDCADSLTFFSNEGYACPMNYNPADYFIFTLAIRPGNEEACLKRSGNICNDFVNTQTAHDLNNLVQLNSASDSTRNKLVTTSPYKASWWTQFKACLWRSGKTVLNDPLVLKVQLAQSVFLSVIMGIVFLDQELDQEGIQNINGFIFMMLANLTFSSVFPVANVFWNELPVFMREHYNGTYRTDAYYLAKTTAELPLYIFLPAIFLSIGYWMVGMNPSADRFLIAIAIAILITNVSSSYGYMVSTVSSSLEMALALAPVFIMPFMIFGGSFLNKDSVNQWKGVENITCSNVGGCIDSGEGVLQMLSFKEDNFGIALGSLGGLIFVVRILSYVGLWAKTRTED